MQSAHSHLTGSGSRMATADESHDEADPPRFARLVLVTPAGLILGSLPAVAVSTPWWPDVQSVVRSVRDRYGFAVTILRFLEAERPRPHGGVVTYLAEAHEPVEAEA